MSNINRLLTCGLLAVSVTGCQTARSVTSHVAQWRPFGQENAESTVVESESTADTPELGEAIAEVEGSTPSADQPLVKEGIPSEIQVVSGAEKQPTVVEQAASQKSSAPESQPAEGGDSFEDFIRSMESQNSAPAENKQKPKQEPKAAPVVESRPADQNSVVEKPAEGTEQLSAQIDALLAQNSVAGSPQAEPAPTAKMLVSEQNPAAQPPVAQPPVATAEAVSSGVQQAALAEQKDASRIAYDLASFADASFKKDIVEVVKESTNQPVQNSQTGLSFEEWAKNSNPQSTTPESSSVVDPFAGSYPWADATQATPAATATPTETTVQAAVPPTKEVNASGKTAPRALNVSTEVLEMLEVALGSENWKKADLATPGSQTSVALSQEEQNIAELMKNESSKVRLRGIRLAYEQSTAQSSLADQVERMLEDKSQTVQAHAASTLYHWNRSPEKVVQTLSTLVTSDNKNAAQLAALFLGDMSREREKVLPVLQTALMSTQGLTLMHVSEALLKHDPKSVDAVARLTELMRHESVEVRWLSAHALGSVQGELRPYAVEALRGGLRDIDPQVRATSALSLGGLGSASQVAVAELTFISTHAEPKVKDAANIALECIHQ